MEPIVKNALTVRKLSERDAEQFRNIRLLALATEGELFGPTVESEAGQTLEQWQERCRETQEKAVFGLFHGGNLIGITQARRYEDDATGQTALWGLTYLRPEYRGKGCATALYLARRDWTANHPTYKQALLFIRDINKRSNGIHRKNGAEFIETREMSWPNRPPALWHWYRVGLKSPAAA